LAVSFGAIVRRRKDDKTEERRGRRSDISTYPKERRLPPIQPAQECVASTNTT
jgi:hypothetical protein